MAYVHSNYSGGAGYIAQRARAAAQDEQARRGRRARNGNARADAETAAEEAAEPEEETAKTGAPGSEPKAVEETSEEQDRNPAGGDGAADPVEETDGDNGEETTATGGDESTGETKNPDDYEVVASSDDADKTGETDEAKKAEAEKKAEELAAFKKQFLAKIDAVARQGHLTKTKISLNITDEGYERMMLDPQYEQRVVDMFRRDLGTTITFPPSSAVLVVDGETEKTTVGYANNLGTAERSTRLLGTMRRSAYSRGGLEMLQSQVMAVLQNRLGDDYDKIGLSSGAASNNPYSSLGGGSGGTVDKTG